MSEQTESQQNYSVKTTTAVKEDLNELLKLTGLPSKELFEAMVTNYKITAMQGTEVEQTVDVQQVRYHLSRAENLFMNLVQKNQDVKQDYTARISQESMLHKQITDELQQQKTLAIQERDRARTEQMELIEEMKKSSELIVELTDRAKSDRITVDVLTKKTEELEVQVTDLPKLEEQTEQLRQDKTSLQHQVDGLQAELSKYKDLLDSTQARISDLSQERERAVQQAQEGAQKDIEQLRYIHQLEMEKATTEADRRVLEAINKTKDEYTVKLDSLAQKNDTIAGKNQELVDRVHTLELLNK
jgi:chromosome segregation ATPase